MTSQPQFLEATETPIDQLLRRQKTLDTPVVRFSRNHRTDRPDLEPHYRQLIPLTAPQAGEQYAFAVDLDRCTGCKACVSACHSLNGLEENETWRDVGLIHGSTSDHPYQQAVTTACHHCEDPACANGCPVLAYEKDPETGIVLHLDDQCIGCQYCILKCPYDVPKYSKSKGIVRKCDMCHDRLSEGEAPACVQACPTEAIRITTVSKTSVIREAVAGHTIIPGAYESDYTHPTTRYITKREIPDNVAAADASLLRPQHAHWPLIWLLLFTQISVGFVGVSLVAGSAYRSAAIVLSVLSCFVGLAASIAHLGRPLKAWRVFLGLRRSWLSREAVAFGIFAKLLAASSICHLEASLVRYQTPMLALSLVVGLLGVFTSAMIYHDTRRAFWDIHLSGTKFFLTSLTAFTLLGAIYGWTFMATASVLLITGKLLWEWAFLHSHLKNSNAQHHKTARIIHELKHDAWAIRWQTAFLSIALMIVTVIGPVAPSAAVIALGLWLVSEFAERYIFFVAVEAPKMPGTFKS